MDIFVPADGRDLGARKRLAANRARRERHENKSAPPARPHDPMTGLPGRRSVEPGRSILTPREAVFGPTRGPLPLPPVPPLSPRSRRITRHTMPSNFHPNSLKTNDGCTRKVTHNSRPSLRFVGRGFNPAVNAAVASLPFAPVHLRDSSGSRITESAIPCATFRIVAAWLPRRTVRTVTLAPANLIDTPAIRNAHTHLKTKDRRLC